MRLLPESAMMMFCAWSKSSDGGELRPAAVKSEPSMVPRRAGGAEPVCAAISAQGR